MESRRAAHVVAIGAPQAEGGGGVAIYTPVGGGHDLSNSWGGDNPAVVLRLSDNPVGVGSDSDGEDSPAGSGSSSGTDDALLGTSVAVVQESVSTSSTGDGSLWLASGAPGAGIDGAIGAGTVAVWKLDHGVDVATGWSAVAGLHSPSPAADDELGVSVDLTVHDSIVVIVAGLYGGTGAARVWSGDSTTSPLDWSTVQLDMVNGASAQGVGTSVAVDSTFTVFVGDPGGGPVNGGVVHVWRPLNGDPTSGTWSSTEEIEAPNAVQTERFGASLSASARLLVVGTPNRDSSSGVNEAGAALVFERLDPDDGDSTFTFRIQLDVDGINEKENLGRSVSVAEGPIIAIGGGHLSGKKQIAGLATVFTPSVTNDLSQPWTERLRILPPVSDVVDEFGRAVAVSRSGLTVACGRKDETAETNDGVAVMAVVPRVDASGVLKAGASVEREFFGVSVSSAVVGSEVLVATGATLSSNEAGETGAFVLWLVDADNIGGAWRTTGRIFNDDAADGALVGSSIAIGHTAAEGNPVPVVAVGEQGMPPSGTVSLWRPSDPEDLAGNWTKLQSLTGPASLGWSLAMDGSTVIAGSPQSNVATVWHAAMDENDGESWSVAATLEWPAGAAVGVPDLGGAGGLGQTVALRLPYAVVSASSAASRDGSVLVYMHDEAGWNTSNESISVLHDYTRTGMRDELGARALAIGGSLASPLIAVSAHGASDVVDGAGAVVLFAPSSGLASPGTEWSVVSRLTAPQADLVGSMGFGAAIRWVSPSTLAIAATGTDSIYLLETHDSDPASLDTEWRVLSRLYGDAESSVGFEMSHVTTAEGTVLFAGAPHQGADRNGAVYYHGSLGRTTAGSASSAGETSLLSAMTRAGCFEQPTDVSDTDTSPPACWPVVVGEGIHDMPSLTPVADFSIVADPLAESKPVLRAAPGGRVITADGVSAFFRGVELRGEETSAGSIPSRGGLLLASATESGATTVRLSDCSLVGGIGVRGGGAYVTGPVHLHLADSAIVDCHAEAGGALWATDGAFVTVSDSIFSDCSSSVASGGAIAVEASSLTVSRSAFRSCSAAVSGGAIAIGFLSTLSIETAEFHDCTAGNRGGGISVDSAHASISHANFTRNTALLGGALVFQSSPTDLPASILDSSVISDCSAAGTIGGGAIGVIQARLDAFDLVLSRNSAPNGVGGGVVIDGGALSAKETTLTANSASAGGGAAVSGAEALLNVTAGSLVDGNSAATSGGGLACSNRAVLQVHNSDLVGNDAAVSGGAVLSEQCDMVVSSAELRGNVAASGMEASTAAEMVEFVGGAIRWVGSASVYASQSRISNASFSDNFAPRGGAVAAYHEDERTCYAASPPCSALSEAVPLRIEVSNSWDVTNEAEIGDGGGHDVWWLSRLPEGGGVPDPTNNRARRASSSSPRVASAPAALEFAQALPASVRTGASWPTEPHIAVVDAYGTRTLPPTTAIISASVADSSSGASLVGALSTVLEADGLGKLSGIRVLAEPNSEVTLRFSFIPAAMKVQSVDGLLDVAGCEPGEQPGTAATEQSCVSCSAGSYSPDGASCLPCRAGTFSDAAGTETCTACPIGTWSDEEGRTSAADCRVCGAGLTTTAGGAATRAACNAIPGWVVTSLSPEGEPLAVMQCPSGADCSEPAMTLATLRVLPGYWRAGVKDVDVRPCPTPELCAGGTIPVADGRGFGDNFSAAALSSYQPSLCVEGSTGAFCSLCIDGWSGARFEPCSPCSDDTAVQAVLLVAVALFTGCTLALVAYIVFRAKGELNAAVRRARVETVKVGGTAKADDASAAQSDEDLKVVRVSAGSPPLSRSLAMGSNTRLTERDRHGLRSLSNRLKIAVSMLQVLATLPSTFSHIEWPRIWVSAAEGVSIFNLDVAALISPGCLIPSDHYSILLLAICVPISIAVAMLLCTLVLRSRATDPDRRAWISSNAYWAFLTLTFLCYPGTSNAVFGVFQCVEFPNGERLLKADYGISCDAPDRGSWIAIAIVGLCIFSVGIPLFYVMELCRHRDRINPVPNGYRSWRELESRADSVEIATAMRTAVAVRLRGNKISRYAFLWAAFKPRYYLFSVWDVVVRLFLTGFVVLFLPGSPTQLAASLLTVLLHTATLAEFRPYVDPLDNNLALMANWCLILTLMGGLLIMTDATKLDDYHGDGLGVVLVAIPMLVIASWVRAVWHVLTDSNRGLRRAVRETKQDHPDIRTCSSRMLVQVISRMQSATPVADGQVVRVGSKSAWH